ncbi:anaphase-promoting complex subunit 5 [Anopheles bellator]|uniref:anaphase-promoting complex subunit 5 n=1 Tax=Anopheles bellator TaxID=139047 RepID=UPI00264A1414|nr:anaphase-promoting complex subunit 5 [Anopheles bellator]
MSKKESENVCFWLPNQCIKKLDALTPHKLAVVFLIQEYMHLKKAVETTHQPPDFGPGDRKRFCLLLLKLIQCPDMPYKDLHGLLVSPVYGLHRVHLEEFLKLMKTLKSVGIDVLFDLYNEIDKLIIDNSNSFHIVSLYLRRVFVMLEKMNFQEMIALYRTTLAYYEKGVRVLRLLGEQSLSDCDSFMKANQYTPIDPPDHGTLASKWSIKQSELFIAQQKSLLEENEVRALPPRELQERVNEIIHDRPLYSRVYFLSYLNAVRVRDFFNALQSLHNFFDRTSGAGALAFSDNKDYQYSSLNLAILHAQFGHRKQALASLRECIMLAQESGDHTCLHLAHAWLYQLDGHRPPLPEKNLNSKLLHATSLRIVAQLRTSCTAGELPSRLFSVLMINDHLNAQKSMMDLVAIGIAERTALWTVYGKHELASLCAQVLLNGSLKSLDKTYNGDGICQALCATVVRLALLGDYSLAIVTLQHAKDRFPRYPQSHHWIVADHYVSSLRAIYRGRWAEARRECLQLYPLDTQLARLLLAHVTLAKQDYNAARDLIRELLADRTISATTRVRTLLLSANVQAQLGQTKAFNVLSEAQQVAEQYHLDYERAVVELHYAYLLLSFFHVPHRALVTLRAGLDTILADGPAYDKARTLFLFARCTIEAAANGVPESERGADGEQARRWRQQQLTTMLPMLEQAIGLFEKLECYSKAKDVYVYLAFAYHELGLVDERNGYACRYRLLEVEHPTPKQFLNVFL